MFKLTGINEWTFVINDNNVVLFDIHYTQWPEEVLTQLRAKKDAKTTRDFYRLETKLKQNSKLNESK